MNLHDSERMAGYLERMGYRSCPEVESADLLLVNSCSIREKADHKAFSLLGILKKLKEDNPEKLLVFAGCTAQLQGERVFKRAPYVDIVLGAQHLDRLPELIKEKQKGRLIEVSDNRAGDQDVFPRSLKAPAQAAKESPTKARVTIVEGCDNFCSYCVVPYARGRERSRPYREIEAEVRKLVDRGCREITLLGQNVNSYGKNTGHSLAFLLKRLNEINDLKRIRFVTSNPIDFGSDLIEAIGSLEKVCEHVHLPVQAGSDRILKLMNRKYTAEKYLRKVEKLKKAVPGVAVTSDIMVGFPGETEDDFQKTLDLIRQVKFDNFYSFIYDDRPRTRAASLPGRIPRKVSSARFARLAAVQKTIFQQITGTMLGREMEVLVEEESGQPGYLTGITRTNRIIHFMGSRKMAGQLRSVRVEEVSGNSLRGRLV